jgi:predicted nuclease of restriction endonuclease-like (RecB) superfamily
LSKGLRLKGRLSVFPERGNDGTRHRTSLDRKIGRSQIQLSPGQKIDILKAHGKGLMQQLFPSVEEAKKMSEINPQQNYSLLIDTIGSTVAEGRQKAVTQINTTLVETNWNIGRHIVEFEQHGAERAEYGSQLLVTLSKDLKVKYGKGFSRSNLFQCRQLYLLFPKIQTLSGKLSWSHYCEILKADNDLESSFYIKQSEAENWSVRELNRQMKSMLFHRLALSTDKAGVLELAEKGKIVTTPLDVVKDPYVLEFLDLPQKAVYLESDLEEALISNLQSFLLELGKGFAFVGRQYRINIGGRQFKIDLVFYHRILKCFVLIDLKRGEIDHHDIGQMNLYLNYFKKEEAADDDKEPIGIVLGAYKDRILMEYATENISNQLFVSRYQLYLPEREELERELKKLLESTLAQQVEG